MSRVLSDPMTTSVRMSATTLPTARKARHNEPGAGCSGRINEEDDGAIFFPLAEQRQSAVQLIRPRARGRIVKGDDEIAARCSLQPPLDGRPRLEIVGKRDGAEIATERRARQGRSRQHRRDARLHADVERAPVRLARLDRFEHGGRHGKNAGIATRNDHHAAPVGGEQSAWRARSISTRLSDP